MNILKGIVSELRERRLWPVAVALLVGLVAVPVVLSKSPSAASSQPQGGGVPASGGHTLAVKLAGTTAQGVHGAPRDPFTQPGGSTTTATVTSSPSTGASSASTGAGAGATSLGAGTGSASSSTTGSGASSAASGTSGGGSSSSSSPSSIPPIPVKTESPKPAPTGLTATQSYEVALDISNASGGLNLIDPLKRLSPIPSAGQPLLVELGVLQGGNRVLFAVQPGTVVDGPGSCTPGPIDCEILSLAQNQTENVSTQSAGGATIAEFAVVGITGADHPSVAAANKARNTVSAAGRGLLTNSSLSALSLFQYEPSVGAVVDLRNLTVGGN